MVNSVDTLLKRGAMLYSEGVIGGRVSHFHSSVPAVHMDGTDNSNTSYSGIYWYTSTSFCHPNVLMEHMDLTGRYAPSQHLRGAHEMEDILDVVHEYIPVLSQMS